MGNNGQRTGQGAERGSSQSQTCWSVHAWWLAILLVLIVRGPGGASLDRRLTLEWVLSDGGL